MGDVVWKYCGEIESTDFIPGNVTDQPDMVQSPPHYQRFGKEVIDIIRDTLGPEGFAAYCQGNEIKYRLRAGFKNDGSEDLAKAMKYYEFRTGCR